MWVSLRYEYYNTMAAYLSPKPLRLLLLSAMDDDGAAEDPTAAWSPSKSLLLAVVALLLLFPFMSTQSKVLLALFTVALEAIVSKLLPAAATGPLDSVTTAGSFDSSSCTAFAREDDGKRRKTEIKDAVKHLLADRYLL